MTACLHHLADGDVHDVPAGVHALPRPVLVTASNVLVRGHQVGGVGSVLRTPGNWLGRALVAAPPVGPVSLTNGPAGVSFNAYPLGYYVGAPFRDMRWFNLRDIDSCYWGGLTQFHLSFWIRLHAPAAGSSVNVAYCGGRLLRWSPRDVLWQVGVHAIDAPFACLTVGGAPHFLHGPPGSLLPGRWHHVALDYDGARVALYLDGAPVNVQMAAGPLDHRAWYDTIIGPAFATAGPIDLDMHAARADIAGLRISRVSRPAAPEVVPTPDADDSIVLNFERPSAVIPGTSDERFVIGRTTIYGLPCWLPQYGGHEDGHYRYGLRLEGVAFECPAASGPLLMQSPDSRIDRVGVQYARHGVTCADNCFKSTFDQVNVNCNAGDFYGVRMPPGHALGFYGAGSGILTLRDVTTVGGAFSIANVGGNVRADGPLFVTPGPETVAALLLAGGGGPNNTSDVAGLYLDDEGGIPAAPLAAVVVEEQASFSLERSNVAPVQHGAVPMVLLGHGNGVVRFSRCYFQNAASTGIVKTLATAAPPASVRADAVRWPHAHVPLEDASGLTGVVDVGVAA